MSDDTVKHDGLVAEIISNRRVVLNKGSRDGISEADEFVVFGLGDEVADPKTGDNLGVLEKIKGKGEVIHVQDRMCTIETYEFDTEPAPNPAYGLSALFPTQRTKKIYRIFVGVERGDYARKIGV